MSNNIDIVNSVHSTPKTQRELKKLYETERAIYRQIDHAITEIERNGRILPDTLHLGSAHCPEIITYKILTKISNPHPDRTHDGFYDIENVWNPLPKIPKVVIYHIESREKHFLNQKKYDRFRLEYNNDYKYRNLLLKQHHDYCHTVELKYFLLKEFVMQNFSSVDICVIYDMFGILYYFNDIISCWRKLYHISMSFDHYSKYAKSRLQKSYYEPDDDNDSLDEIFCECKEDCYVNDVNYDSAEQEYSSTDDIYGDVGDAAGECHWSDDTSEDFYKSYKNNNPVYDTLCGCKEECHFSSVSEDSYDEHVDHNERFFFR